MPKSVGEELLEKAEKKAKSASGLLSSFTFNSSSKLEEAGNLYEKAANAFWIEKQYKAAGEAHVMEARLREKCMDIDGENNAAIAASAWWNAAKAYKLIEDFDLAIQYLGCAIMHLAKEGRFRQAADREKNIAEIYELDLKDIAKACDNYKQAAEWYEQDGAAATASACRKHAADLCAELEDYQTAIQLYDTVAKHALRSNLAKYSVKDYWLRSGLCTLAMGDVEKAEINIEGFKSTDVTFSRTRECKFLEVICTVVNQGDEQGFMAAVGEYDQLMQLDSSKASVLSKIKESLKAVDIL